MTVWMIRLYALSIAAMSLKTFLEPEYPWPVKLLAGTEILMAALFVPDRTRIFGLYGLLAIFVLATVLEAASGGFPFRFAVYAIAGLSLHQAFENRNAVSRL